MKLYTVVVYDPRMRMKGDNTRPKIIKGDNSREIIICAGWGYLLLSFDSQFLFINQ